jgi:hypothetical protein
VDAPPVDFAGLASFIQDELTPFAGLAAFRFYLRTRGGVYVENRPEGSKK